MTFSEEIAPKKNSCLHNVSIKHRCGVTIINARPLFSHDSQNIIIANGPDIKVFSIKSGECILTMKHHTNPIIGLQENQNNMLQFYSCSDDGTVVKWDYTGRILQVYELGLSVVCFYAPYPKEKIFITRKHENGYGLYSLIPKSKGCCDLHCIQETVLPEENTIDFSIKHKFIASVHENKLTINFYDSKKIIRHLTGERKLTCVACHPSDAVLATGDHHGRVIIWYEALRNNHPVKSIYHWHTLPVADIAFSQEGSYIHSGGGECALVKWNLFAEGRHVLPRLGAPIQRIVASKDNNFVVTTHSDNVLQVISAQKNIVQAIQGLTKSFPIYGHVLPVGLLYNAQLRTLVMNGKPGHLQFFDLKQSKLLFNLDIASRNFISQNRDLNVYNIDVHKAAMDDVGLWLATSEYWHNNEVSPHVWLKFWEYDLETQMFMLNTNVKFPHNKDLNFIAFKPKSKTSDDSPLAVTTSNDGCFKLWTLHTFPNEKKPSWACEFTGHYRDMIPQTATFSEDGTTLAVAFGRAATLWIMNSFTLKAVLYQKKSKVDIKQLLFGRCAALKYLISHDGTSITVWDCSSLSIHWTVHYEIEFLVADPYSDNIAAFCKDQNLKIFKPSNPLPLDYIHKVSNTQIVGGVFVPSSNCNGITGCFKEKSQLYFMDTEQNLITITEADEDEEIEYINKKSVAQNITATPFGLLQAAQSVSDVKPVKVEQFNINSNQEINIIPNPTWQDPEALLKPLLPSLLIKEKEETPQEPMSVEEKTNNKENVKEHSIQIEQSQAWLTDSLNNIEIKPIDFSFVTDNVLDLKNDPDLKET